MKNIFLTLLLSFNVLSIHASTHSVARIWNEMQLNAIRIDAARPPVQARNLFHVSLAMYDAWAAYDSIASTYLLGNTINGVTYSFSGIPMPANINAARNKAISYAAYRVLQNRYSLSPNWYTTSLKLDSAFLSLGYDNSIVTTNYANGDPAELGNYIAQQIIAMGYNDGANQINNYAGTGYTPNNSPLFLFYPGNATMTNVNSWQPLSYLTCIDQNGIPCGSSTPNFVCPLWGKVLPFSMPTSTATMYNRSGVSYPVYFDPGIPPLLNTSNVNDSSSQLLKWGHSMVASWSSHLDPSDPTLWDISPHGKGNIQSYPTTYSLSSLQSFYNFTTGASMGNGYTANPITGLAYPTQNVKRGDYTRVASQYWADGPNSETPPGHWFTLLNNVSDYPGFQKKIGGAGPLCSDLEWDVKSYFSLGSAMHDAAIACWGIKGWYDSPRPISMIRKMAELGQCSNPLLPHYHPGGLQLITGYIELVTLSDPASLRGVGNVNVHKIKLKAWKGFSNIFTSNGIPINAAGVGWILAENWMPYQRETFVSPPFAGYTSGHSTYSRAGAVCLTNLTGSPYFPGGLAEYIIPANSNFIGFEKSPTTQIKLQWASYMDASDEASLSRIWGGIHPPFDDLPGRAIGEQIGNQTFNKAKSYFDHQVVSVSIVCNPANPVCTASTITLYASTQHAPATTIFTWKKNGVIISSGNVDSIHVSSFTNGDVFICEITAIGYTVASNSIEINSNCPPYALPIKVMLQGYYIGNGFMSAVLANQGVGADPMLTDSIDIELHSKQAPYQWIETSRVPLMTDGSAVGQFSSPIDDYFIAIKHRSTIETWSAEPVTIGTSIPYDFSISRNNSYGNNVTEVENDIWAFYTGELNNDNNIDLIDLAFLETDISTFSFGYKNSDINGDGNVDLLDSPMIEDNVSNFIFSMHP